MNILKGDETDVKNKTRAELEKRVKKLERIIATKGIGSEYVAKVERLQRNVNLALILLGTSLIIGVTAWTIFNSANSNEE